MPKVLDQQLYNKVKAEADIKYKKPSAYKSMFIVKRYKELGGKYADDGTPKNLDRWKKEEWVDIAGLDYPVYRPTKRISKDTPLTVNEIDPTSLVKQSILKQKIKGKSNLPPFVAKGGKRTAKEIRDFLDASYDKNPPEKIDDWILDKELSTNTAVVYFNPKTNETVVAHRGTQGVLDWGNNLAYALGYYDYTPRYKQGKLVQDNAEKKYGKENISTLGHSQGAILARKLGADTKEVINVNPAYMGEKPAKNEYNIRSKSDVVSGLYAPVSYTRSILFPKYTEKHDIIIPSKSKTDILGEHSYEILNRLGNKEIGVGAGKKILTNTIMKSKNGMKKKINLLVSLGMPRNVIDLLFKTGSLETVWSSVVSGKDIKPLLNKVLESLEPQKISGSIFDLNDIGGTLDEDPVREVEVSEPVNFEDIGFKEVYNIGDADFSLEGGAKYKHLLPSSILKGGKSRDKLFNEMSKMFAIYKNQHPKTRIRDEVGYAKKLIKEKPSKRLVDIAKAFLKQNGMSGGGAGASTAEMKGGMIVTDEIRSEVNDIIDTVDYYGYYRNTLSLTPKKIAYIRRLILEQYLPALPDDTEIDATLINKLFRKARVEEF